MFPAILKRIGIINLADRACSVVSRQICGANSRGMDPQTSQSSTRQDVQSESCKQGTQMSEHMETSSPDRKRARTDEMNSETVLKFSKMSEHAFAPTKGSKQAAGFDLYSAYDYTIEARGKVLAKTDINIALPEGCYGRVAPRSGLAHRHFIDVGAGVIDQDYRGNVGVVMFNFSDKPFEVKKGDRIAQLICERIYTPDIVEIECLDKTDRGAGGFGSTGISLTETNGTQSKEVNGTDSKETNGTDVKETNGIDGKETNGIDGLDTNGIDSKETNGIDNKATNGTDSKESSGTDSKETTETDAKETSGTDAKETDGTDAKETGETDVKETSGTEVKETGGKDSKEAMETS